MLLSPKKSLKRLKKKTSLRMDEIKTIINDQLRLPYLSAEKVSESNRKNQVDSLSSKFEQFKHKFQNQNKSNQKLFFRLARDNQKQKLNYDQHLVSSKLKQIENKFESEYSQLDKKSPRKKNVYRNQNRTIDVLPPTTYLQQYGNMVNNLANIHKKNSQDTQNQNQQHRTIESNDILHYDQLKKRPKFLNYLKNKIMQSRTNTLVTLVTQQIVGQQSVIQNQYVKELQKQFEQAMKIMKNEGPSHNPENIIRKQFQKLFSKKNDIHLSNQVKERQLCKQMIKKQQEISLKNPQMSEQNKKKLQQKFNQIIKMISKTDRLTQAKKSSSPTIHLPKIISQ